MYNTFGLHAINGKTFNPVNETESKIFSRGTRDDILSALRINNFILRLLEWIPFTSVIAGTSRMCAGTVMIGLALFGGQNGFEGRMYAEALETGIAQVARGFTVTLGPTARTALLILDALFTMRNIQATKDIQSLDSYEYNSIPYKEDSYNTLLSPLYIG